MTEPKAPEHLDATRSDRGFDRLPPIPSEYGGQVQVYESSSAMAPAVWLFATAPADMNNPSGPVVEAPMHLTAENAWQLAEQLMTLVANHYQGDARPDERAADLKVEGKFGDDGQTGGQHAKPVPCGNPDANCRRLGGRARCGSCTDDEPRGGA